MKSPMVELLVGRGGEATTLVAHEALLMQSQWFVEAYRKLPMNERVSAVSGP